MSLFFHVLFNILLTALQFHHDFLHASLLYIVVISLTASKEVKGLSPVCKRFVLPFELLLIEQSHLLLSGARFIIGFLDFVLRIHSLHGAEHTHLVAQRLVALAQGIRSNRHALAVTCLALSDLGVHAIQCRFYSMLLLRLHALLEFLNLGLLLLLLLNELLNAFHAHLLQLFKLFFALFIVFLPFLVF